ncbi:TPA: RNA polymerase subunit sigma [Candidatus Latescibacteria bacterium]|nr:RNA polymerase subunit sigma [Candidatus Latescibacterota bacterium]
MLGVIDMSTTATLSKNLETASDLPDAELCRMANDGQADAAFAAMYERYRDRIMRLASAFARDEDDAQDITQQVFIRAHRSIHHFRGHAQLYTWLYRITVNCCKDWIKQASQARCEHRDPSWWSERDLGESLFTEANRAEAGVERREAGEALQQALTALSPEFRSTLVLREIDGLSYREVGQTLGCSEGTVKSRICRARRQLRRELTRLGYAS